MRLFVFILLPLSIVSQNINAKVYDHESTVKGIKVFNISKKTKTYTDNDGNFTIPASVSDTLLFESLFHHNKKVILNKNNFNNIAVFELKKIINALGEVLITDEKTKTFNPLEYGEAVGFSIQEAIKRNPHLYSTSSQYGIDFVRVAKLVDKLFKKKIKIQDKPIELITYNTLDSLFKHDDLFNLKLLNQQLMIPEAYANLFLDYCENKQLKKNLLKKENKVILLDSLFKFSDTFLNSANNASKAENAFPEKN